MKVKVYRFDIKDKYCFSDSGMTIHREKQKGQLGERERVTRMRGSELETTRWKIVHTYSHT